jgi:peptidoglycan/LPS O-acetylase OafA/YrhL
MALPPDFFAAIVALSSVTMLAKFVTHRSRHKPEVAVHRRRLWRGLHVACVLLSFASLFLAFAGFAYAEAPTWAVLAVIPGAAAMVILVVDGLCDDSRRLAK